MIRVLVLGVLLALAGCDRAPEEPVELLEMAPDAPVWPNPPERARYAHLGTLVGEQDMDRATGDDGLTLKTAFSWLVGLAVGEGERLELRRPTAGAVDDSGRIFVVDASLLAVMVFDPVAARVRRWDEAAPGLGFVNPVAVAPDGLGGVWVTDAARREVFRLDAQGKPLARIGRNLLLRPTGLVRDPASGLIYVADTLAHDIKAFDATGALVEVIGRRGVGRGEMNFPTHLAIESGRLFVADTLNFRVQIFDILGDERGSFGETGLYVGNMVRPKGVAVGRDGRIYVSESYYDHLLVFDPKGELLLPIGGTGKATGEFYLPQGLWTDSTGRVFVADMFNGRVEVFQELTGLDRG